MVGRGILANVADRSESVEAIVTYPPSVAELYITWNTEKALVAPPLALSISIATLPAFLRLHVEIPVLTKHTLAGRWALVLQDWLRPTDSGNAVSHKYTG